MPILNSLARMVAKPLPRMLSPKTHAVVDYLTLGSFLMSAGYFWRHSKRASLAALICGSAGLAVNLFTDYPGGVERAISFRTHRDIDRGLAAMTAAMPEFLAFKDDPQRKFFLAQGAIIAATTELTQFPDKSRHAERRVRRARAA